MSTHGNDQADGWLDQVGGEWQLDPAHVSTFGPEAATIGPPASHPVLAGARSEHTGRAPGDGR